MKLKELIEEKNNPKIIISTDDNKRLLEFIVMLEDAITNCCSPQTAYDEVSSLFYDVEFVGNTNYKKEAQNNCEHKWKVFDIDNIKEETTCGYYHSKIVSMVCEKCGELKTKEISL